MPAWAGDLKNWFRVLWWHLQQIFNCVVQQLQGFLKEWNYRICKTNKQWIQKSPVLLLLLPLALNPWVRLDYLF
jgi:hypothetical protein